jgi:hypothetical protein
VFKQIKSKGIIVALMAAFFLTGSVVPAHAVDRDDNCERIIRKAESNLHNAIRKHGEHSRQAAKRRHELEEARERCRVRGDHDHH